MQPQECHVPIVTGLLVSDKNWHIDELTRTDFIGEAVVAMTALSSVRFYKFYQL
ncbi:hypothetical protein HanXRQr2_Chr16g0756721 [Helianthus annuus]|uniref:Uncharacterized protein n=1 Tax=Helianthus annuus TaxID=4232 RepID=A0A9K3DUW8_HELAN|nr:hypothetical protein HanXRQr2_Chr16g0756721 [Helianthus annuus]KAJ0821868.1 hypothetical protein HanPSC8_Chr16g0725251 [Helianthus annuus]